MKLHYYKEGLLKSLKNLYFSKLEQYVPGMKDVLINEIPFVVHNAHVPQELIKDMNQYNYGVADYLSGEDLINPRSNYMQDKERQIQNINSLLQIMFDNELSATTKLVIETLNLFDDQSVLVGGAIRDALDGKDPHDYDFATSIPYELLEVIFKGRGFKCIEAGNQFKVLHISKNNEKFEIANFRCDGEYINGKPVQVKIGTIEDDAYRRDFTVNSLMVDLKSVTILDITGKGIDDTISKTLRFVGNPQERLDEDLLRVYRAYRFAAKGYKMEQKTLTAVRRNFECAQKTVAFERVKNELEKL